MSQDGLLEETEDFESARVPNDAGLVGSATLCLVRNWTKQVIDHQVRSSLFHDRDTFERYLQGVLGTLT